MKEKKVWLSLFIEEELRDIIKNEAEKEDRSMNYVVEKILQREFQ